MESVTILLAGLDENALAELAYPAFAAAGFDIAAIVSTADLLADTVAALEKEIYVLVEAQLFAEPDVATGALAALAPAQVVVILPSWWQAEQERFEELPNLIRGFTAPVSWPQVAAELKLLLAERSLVTGRPVEDGALPLTEQTEELQGNSHVVALWSGPAGGTGRTTLALTLAILAAERGCRTVLLALSEPAVGATLGLSRLPDATSFLTSKSSTLAGEQKLGWQGANRKLELAVVLGPAGPPGVASGVEQPPNRGQVAGLIAAARATYELVVIDLPPLTADGSAWVLEPLTCCTDVVLVTPPSGAGIVASLSALAALRALKSPSHVHLLLNRRSPGGLPAQRLVESVEGTWGSCPHVAAEIDFLPQLCDLMDRGEFPDAILRSSTGMEPMLSGVEALARSVAAISPVESFSETGRPEGGRGRRSPRPRRLISLEMTD